MANEIEHELRLALEPGKVRRLRSHPLLKAHAAAPGRTRRLRSVYFDTADRKLRQNELSLRIRRDGRKRIQTLKAADAGAAAGLQNRLELEAEVTGDTPDLALLDTRALGRRLPVDGDGAGLEPVFETDVRRTAWQLQLDDGSEVELAVDVGELKCGRDRLPICEAEIELKSGPVSRLYDLAAALHRDLPFRLENRSKSERGYQLAAGAAPQAVKARPVALTRDMRTEDAFRAIARACLQQLEANETCALAGQDPEGIHQMRVALRRLRSAFALFAPALPAGAADHLEDLRWIAQELGRARDWDVFVSQTLAPLVRRTGDDPSLAAFAAAAERCRAHAYEVARRAIRSRRYTETKLRLGQWLAQDDWPAQGGPAAQWLNAPAAEYADAVLQRRYRKLRKLGRRHAGLTLPELHRMRIQAKKLRYAAEFFRSLYGRKPARGFIEALAALQDVLGVINDAATGQTLLQEAADCAGRARRRFDRANALVAGWFAALTDDHLGRLAAQWDAFAERVPFWDRPTLDPFGKAETAAAG